MAGWEESTGVRAMSNYPLAAREDWLGEKNFRHDRIHTAHQADLRKLEESISEVLGEIDLRSANRKDRLFLSGFVALQVAAALYLANSKYESLITRSINRKSLNALGSSFAVKLLKTEFVFQANPPPRIPRKYYPGSIHESYLIELYRQHRDEQSAGLANVLCFPRAIEVDQSDKAGSGLPGNWQLRQRGSPLRFEPTDSLTGYLKKYATRLRQEALLLQSMKTNFDQNAGRASSDADDRGLPDEMAKKILSSTVTGIIATIARGLRSEGSQTPLPLTRGGRFLDVVAEVVKERLPVSLYDMEDFLSQLHTELLPVASSGGMKGEWGSLVAKDIDLFVVAKNSLN